MVEKIPEFKPGDTIKVFEKIPKEKRTQVFEGICIAKKHGKEPGATFTVRGKVLGQWVEKIYPLFSPLIEKIEVVKRGKVRKAKLYFIREKSEKEIKRKLKQS